MSDMDVDLDKMEDFRDAMDARLEELKPFEDSTLEGGSLFVALKLGGGGGPEGQSADSYSTDSPSATFQSATRAAGYWTSEELTKLQTAAAHLKSATATMRDAADTILGNTSATEDVNAQDSAARESGIYT